MNANPYARTRRGRGLVGEFLVVMLGVLVAHLFSSRSGWRGGAPELLSRHRGPRQAQVYGEIYQGMEEFSLLAQQEQANWARLQTLQEKEGAVDSPRRWRLREEIAGARNANLLLTAIADQMLQRLVSLGVDVDSEPLPVDMRQRPVCQPMQLVGAAA